MISNQFLGLISLVVRDYDEAITFFVDKLCFELVEDTFIPEQKKRWVIVKPPGNGGANLVLARASTLEQTNAIGKQTGGRVFLFLYTNDFWRDYKNYLDRGIEFIREPQIFSYGIVAVFKDISGNLWDLIQPNNQLANRKKSGIM